MNTETIIDVSFDKDKFQYKKIGPDKWQMTSDITTSITIDKRETYTYDIKTGFETNFRSGPRWLNAIADKIGKPPIAMSWLIHDVNYEGYLSRRRADSLLCAMLAKGGLGSLTNEMIFVGLQAFGGFNYDDTRNNQHIIFTHQIKPRPRQAIASDINNLITFDPKNMKKVKEQLMKMATTEEDMQTLETAIKECYQ